jgi:hypothetical protein
LGAGPWRGGEPATSKLHGDLALWAAGPPGVTPSAADGGRFATALRDVGQDDVVVDLPGGLHDAAMAVWLRADVRVLVATPERGTLDAALRFALGAVLAAQRGRLRRRLGARVDAAVAEAFRLSEGRPGAALRKLARTAGLDSDTLVLPGASPVLVLNRVRRGDDIDAGHDLAAAAAGLGAGLRLGGAFVWHEDGWIRARRGPAMPQDHDVLCGEADEFIARVDRGAPLPRRDGSWKELTELSIRAAAGGATAEAPPAAPWTR